MCCKHCTIKNYCSDALPHGGKSACKGCLGCLYLQYGGMLVQCGRVTHDGVLSLNMFVMEVLVKGLHR